MSVKPVVCKNETQVGDAAFASSRRRPVVAINENGDLVVCCRRTAKLHGWKIEGAMFQRKASVAELLK